MDLKEALSFLENILHITNAQVKLKENRFKFLREILYKFLHAEPFQNLTILSENEEHRHLPTPKECKEDVFESKGGLCYTTNLFMKDLLESLDFSVFYCSMSVLETDNNHLCMLVRDLEKPGDLHLVDVGLGHATWDPIPFDFELESPIYHVGILYFKFIREGDVITRLHKHDRKMTFPLNINSKEWHVFGKMKITSREIDCFKEVMTNIYTVPGAYTSRFLLDLNCVTFKKEKLIAIKNTTLLFENDDQQLEIKELNTRKNLISTILLYFPTFGREMVEAAINASPTCSKLAES